MIGKILYFYPPRFAYGEQNKDNKWRYMLVISEDDDSLYLLNISSIDKNKTNCLIYNCNFRIKKYNPPLKKPSFIKMNSLYILEKFNNISKLIYSNGGYLDHKCFLEII